MLTLVPTPIGNIGDLTLRTLDVLQGADVLLCEDTRVTRKLLTIIAERYQRSSTPQLIAVHSHNEARFLQSLDPVFFDRNVVYASDAGMPGISDPGQMLVRYCIDHGIPYDVLPGANAVLTAFAASGFVRTQMLFFGFLPHKGGDRKSALQSALYNGYTTVLYESPHRLCKLLEELAAEVPERQIFAAKELTKQHQAYFHGTAQQVRSAVGDTVRGEWVVVIEAGEARTTTLGESDILALDLPKKAAAKLIAKITGEPVKQCYERLIAK